MTTQLLLNEPPLQVLPTLAKVIGLNEAVVLQQIHYWLNPRINKNYADGHYWVYNTYGKWQEQFPFLSERTLRRTIKNLETLNFLIASHCEKLNYGKFYTINYDVLQKTCLDADPVNKGNKQLSLSQNDIPSQRRGLSYPQENGEENLKPQGRDQGGYGRKKADTGYQPCLPPPSLATLPSSGEYKGEYPIQSPESGDTHSHWPTWPDRQDNLADSPGQSGQANWPTWPHPPASLSTLPGQIGQNIYMDTETTSETTPENIYPPLLSTPARARKEEEEEEKNQSYSGGYPPHPPVPHETIQGNPHSLDQTPKEETAMDTTPQTRQETQTFEDMVDLWNGIVHAKLNPGIDKGVVAVTLTEKRQQLLKVFWNRFLKGDKGQSPLWKWKEYCTLIANSKYLAGNNSSGFKVTLDWALVPDNALKVWEGGIYDKREPAPPTLPSVVPWEQFSEKLARSLPSSPYLSQWLKISLSLAQMIGQPKYRSWFLRVVVRELTATKITFSVEGSFFKTYIVNNFSSEIRCAVQAHYPTVTQIDFEASLGERGCQGGVL